MTTLVKTYIIGGYNKRTEDFFFTDNLPPIKLKQLTRRMLDESVENKYILDKFLNRIRKFVFNSSYAWYLQSDCSNNLELELELKNSVHFKNSYWHKDLVLSLSYNIIHEELYSYLETKIREHKIYFKDGLAKKVLDFYTNGLKKDELSKKIAINYKVDLNSAFEEMQVEYPELFKVLSKTKILEECEQLLSSDIEHTIEKYPIKYAVIERVPTEHVFLHLE